MSGTPRSIVITGASSGVGRALALHYAGKGVTLGLCGRDRARLDAVAAACRNAGAQASIAAIDGRDRAAMRAFIEAFDAAHPIDLLVANAGVMEGRRPGGVIEPPEAAYAMTEINVLGVMNAVQPALTLMLERGAGQVAMMSSIAAFTPVPDSPAYSASKAAVLNYGLSLRALLAPRGIRVSVICPGYIDTPMMQREHGPKPFKMTAEKAATLIARGLRRDRATIAFPRLFALVTRISGLLPDRARRLLTNAFRFTVSER